MTVVKALREVFLNSPPGHDTGKPFDRDFQMVIPRDVLSALATAEQPGTIVDLPYE